MEIIGLIAIVVGPILAVLAGRFLDIRKENEDRKTEVFKTLMRTRRNVISSEHVGALNLVELEYASNKEVIRKWQDLYRHFGNSHPRKPNETVITTDEIKVAIAKNAKFNERMIQERQSLLAKLLHEMAKDRRFKAEQLEIFEGGYTPQGWVDVENDQEILRNQLIKLLHGEGSLPIFIVDGPGAARHADDYRSLSDRG